MRESYPQLSDLAFRILFPLPQYIYTRVAFSSGHIKTKAPNWRKVEDDTRRALSNKVGHTVAKSKVALKMFMKFNGRLKLDVMKCIFVVHSSKLVIVCCIFLEMYFVVIIVVIIVYIEKRAERRSQAVWRYQRESRAEQGWEILHSTVWPSAKRSILKVAPSPINRPPLVEQSLTFWSGDRIDLNFFRSLKNIRSMIEKINSGCFIYTCFMYSCRSVTTSGCGTHHCLLTPWATRLYFRSHCYTGSQSMATPHVTSSLGTHPVTPSTRLDGFSSVRYDLTGIAVFNQLYHIAGYRIKPVFAIYKWIGEEGCSRSRVTHLKYIDQGWPNCGSSNLCMRLFELFENHFISIAKCRNIAKCYCRTVLLLQVVTKRIMMSQKRRFQINSCF